MTYKKNSREAKLGDLGEEIVDKYLTGLGYHIYKKINDGSHPIDRTALHFKSNKQNFILDVKTKEYYKKLRASGFNVHSFKTYEELDTPGMPVGIFFVDSGTGSIYGNWLSELKKPLTRGGTTFPKIINGRTGSVIMFPVENMKKFTSLTPEEISSLKTVNNERLSK